MGSIRNDDPNESPAKMSSRKIIGLTGRRRSGKDTVASFLVDRGFTRLSFADPLKEAVKSLFFFSDDQLEKRKEQVDPRYGVSPRRVLQCLGTDLIRDQLQDLLGMSEPIFLASMRSRIDAITTTCRTRVVISDVRFPDEARLIRELGGVVFRVVRPAVETDETVDRHASEIAMDDEPVEMVIENDGSIEDLHRRLEQLL